MSYITFQPHDYFNTKLYTGNAGTNARGDVIGPGGKIVKKREE